ncbi:RNA-binding protein squid-like [Periplaneta americana]|uniref:RNA-binding protein squid-like n=1 Tax=Periplaneta americana TaxID=6978 RepID=UPI0037E75FB6
MDYYQDYHEDPRIAAGNGHDNRGTAGIPGRDDDRKLFVGGLSRQTTDRELKEHFGKFGEIESVTVKVDPYTGQSRGFAFIVFSNPKTIDKLLTSGDHYINKRKVDPKRVSKKTQHGKIFVGGLTPDISDGDIRSYFSQYGTIVEVQAPFDKVKNQRKGFCFITFDSKNVVYQLLKNPKQYINGKEVDVKKVKINPETMGIGGGRGAFRGDARGWGAGYAYGGYGHDYGAGYGSSGYNNYDYGGPYNDYSGYGYTNSGGSQGYGTKLRAGSRQFQRHQPY